MWDGQACIVAIRGVHDLTVKLIDDALMSLRHRLCEVFFHRSHHCTLQERNLSVECQVMSDWMILDTLLPAQPHHDPDDHPQHEVLSKLDVMEA